MDKLIQTIRAAKHIVILTGAGVSAESGIPTFREAQTGLWAQYEPTELASPEAFDRDPQVVWDWYAWRRELCAAKAPNAGHLALVELAALVPKLTLVTQNVDGLHQRAGSADVIELHGNIERIICRHHHHIAENWRDLTGTPPKCPTCGSLLRPDVVWFGENLPLEQVQRAFDSAEACDLIFSIGTSSVVYPAAYLPQQAKLNDALFVEINPDETPISYMADFIIRAPSGKALPAIVQALKLSF